MTSNYFKKDLGHIFDLAERYDFVKDDRKGEALAGFLNKNGINEM